MTPQVVALLLATVLILFGIVSAYFQLHSRRDLNQRTHVPSDESTYLRGRYRRRLLVSVLLILGGGMIGGAYLFGLEATADTLKPEQDANGVKKPMTAQDRQFVPLWGGYWITVILIAGVIVAVG